MALLFVLMGWPAVFLSLFCSLSGVVFRKPGAVAVGVIFALPFLWYLALTPGLRYVSPAVGLLYLAAVYSVAKGQSWISWSLLAPFMALALYLAVVTSAP